MIVGSKGGVGGADGSATRGGLGAVGGIDALALRSRRARTYCVVTNIRTTATINVNNTASGVVTNGRISAPTNAIAAPSTCSPTRWKSDLNRIITRSPTVTKAIASTSPMPRTVTPPIRQLGRKGPAVDYRR